MWITKMGFCPSDWRDILWALSSDMIQEAWPCVTWLSVNQGNRLRVSRMNRISRIEKRVELLKGWRLIAYSLTRYIVRQKGLRRKPHWKVCRHDSMVLGSWHVLLGAATNWSIASRTPIDQSVAAPSRTYRLPSTIESWWHTFQCDICLSPFCLTIYLVEL